MVFDLTFHLPHGAEGQVQFLNKYSSNNTWAMYEKILIISARRLNYWDCYDHIWYTSWQWRKARIITSSSFLKNRMNVLLKLSEISLNDYVGMIFLMLNKRSHWICVFL
jgi:hypothetical protein